MLGRETGGLAEIRRQQILFEAPVALGVNVFTGTLYLHGTADPDRDQTAYLPKSHIPILDLPGMQASSGQKRGRSFEGLS